MDTHFANMRSLIQVSQPQRAPHSKPLCPLIAAARLHPPRLLPQILDSELFELMHQNGDYTHFYFCYRWFLLDFKRGKVKLHRQELSYWSSSACGSNALSQTVCGSLNRCHEVNMAQENFKCCFL